MAKRDQVHQRLLQIKITTYHVIVYKYTCILLHKYTQARKSELWEMKAEELQIAADKNNIKVLCRGLKEVWGTPTEQPVHLKSSDKGGGGTFSDSKSVMARWS